MLAARIARTQPRLADLVGNIEEMQLMRSAHRREHSRAHARAAGVLKGKSSTTETPACSNARR
jgi:hypothetical protein